MPDVLAICNNCGTIFNSGIYIENSTNVTLKGINTRCPRCGGISSVPEGTFNFIGNTIELISGPEITLRKLILFKTIVEKAINENRDLANFQEEIRKDAPELNRLSDLLPRTRNELYAFMTLLLAIITLVINKCEKGDEKTITIDQAINTYNTYYISNTKSINNDGNLTISLSDSNKTDFHGVGRNERCPCGSGKKYKYCHGQKINR